MFTRYIASRVVDALIWELKNRASPNELAADIGITPERLLSVTTGLGATARSRPKIVEWVARRWSIDLDSMGWCFFKDLESGLCTQADIERIERAEAAVRDQWNDEVVARLDEQDARAAEERDRRDREREEKEAAPPKLRLLATLSRKVDR